MALADDEGAPSDIGELVALLDLEVLDRDLYRAHNPRRGQPRARLYGGQVAAQALRAATLTVDADRRPHSLHGYFLRPGRTDVPTIVKVERDLDGRSVSSRRVVAVQDGRSIFTMSASFVVEGGTGPQHQQGPDPGTPGPEEAGPSIVFVPHPAFEVRPVPTANGGELGDVYWSRPHEPLPEDPSVHACVLTYLTDMGVGEGHLHGDLLGRDKPSIDHSVWFHREARMDDWVLFAMEPVSAQEGRLLYRGSVFAPGGQLLASMAQEALLRPRRE